jgi:hypothetical protein
VAYKLVRSLLSPPTKPDNPKGLLMSRRPRATMPVGSLVYLNLREPLLAELPRIPLPRLYEKWLEKL